MYLDEDLSDHPKLFEIGHQFGPHGPALVLALHVAGISYSRKFLTDGHVPDTFLTSLRLIPDATLLAKAMSRGARRMWIRVRNGYVIKDWFHWNKSAKEIKELKEKERLRKAESRRRVRPDVQEDKPHNVHHVSGRTSDRTAEYHVHDHVHSSTYVQAGAAPPSDFSTAVENPSPKHDRQPTAAQLAKVAHTVIDEHPDDTFTDWKDGIKAACAAFKFDYDAEAAGKALDSALRQRELAKMRSKLSIVKAG